MAAILVKGDKAPDVYSLNTTTGRRRYVDINEYRCRTGAGESVTVVPQVHLDNVPKE